VAAGIIPPVVVVDRTEMTIEEITSKVLTEMTRREESRAARLRLDALALATGRDPATRIKTAREKIGV
jgi:hypothetical protein